MLTDLQSLVLVLLLLSHIVALTKNSPVHKITCLGLMFVNFLLMIPAHCRLVHPVRLDAKLTSEPGFIVCENKELKATRTIVLTILKIIGDCFFRTSYIMSTR